MAKFTDLLDEYLELRDQQKSDYYENRYIGERYDDIERMRVLRDKMDSMIESTDIKFWVP